MKYLFATAALVPSLVPAQAYDPSGESRHDEVGKRHAWIRYCTFDKSALGGLNVFNGRCSDTGNRLQEIVEPAGMRPRERRSTPFKTDGTLRLRVQNPNGVTDYGSAVCVGYGRRPGEWTFLSCSHNLESGGVPEISAGGEWFAATVLYRDKLARAVKSGPGQYTRVSDGPDRSVLVISHPDQLPFQPVSLDRHAGSIALCGYPSTTTPVIISGQTKPHHRQLSAKLQRPSQGGFSGGGVFNQLGELVGIWTSGSNGSGYGHHVSEFVPIFRRLGWLPANWPELPGETGATISDAAYSSERRQL